MNLNTGKELQTVSFFWQMRSTVLHRRRSQHFWRLWKKIPSVSMVRHMCCTAVYLYRNTEPLGFSGTQPLPESQLDRFMVCLSIGYPTLENQMKIINAQRYVNLLSEVRAVTSAQNVLEVQNYLSSVELKDSVLRYAIRLCEETRRHPLIELGISPRGVSALVKMARANALIRERNYVIPEDVQSVFCDVCAHRLVLRPQAQVEGVQAKDILGEILLKLRPGTEE